MQAASTAFATQIAGNDMIVQHYVSILGIQAYRTNLSPNPAFRTATTGYAGVGTVPPSVGRTSSNGFNTSSSLIATWGNGGTGPGVTFPAFTTQVGDTYTISCYVYVPNDGSPAVQLKFGSAVGIPSSTPGAIQRISITVVATSTSTVITLVPTAVPGTTGKSVYLSAVLVEETDNLFDYFDGDSVSGVWTGTAEVSTSTLTFFQDATLAVESLEIDRQLTTDMPNGTRLLVGYPSAEATIDLSGLVDQSDESKTISWLLNPDNEDSPLFRQDVLGAFVQIQAGLFVGGSVTPELITVFTGVITDYDCDDKGGVSLTCLDYRDKIRSVAALPSFAAYSTAYWAQNPGLSASYVLEAILRNSGIYAGPTTRSSLFYYQSMHGSMWPEVNGGAVTSQLQGNLGMPDFMQGYWSPQIPNPFTRGAVGTGSSANLSNVFVVNLAGTTYMYVEWMQFISSTSGGMAVNIGSGGSSGFPAGEAFISLNADYSTAVELDVNWVGFTSSGSHSGGGATSSLTNHVGDAWHMVAFQVVFDSVAQTITVQFKLDGLPYGSGTITGVLGSGNLTAPYNIFDSIGIVADAPYEMLQFTNESAPVPTVPANVVPGAVLDASLNIDMLTIPDISGNDGWASIQQICDAELGFGGFDELGIFRFFNRQTLRSRILAPSRTITSTSSLKAIASEMSTANVVNHCTVPINLLALSAPTTVWSAGSVLSIPANTAAASILVDLSDQAVNLTQLSTGYYPGPGTALPAGTYWRASTTPDGTGAAVTGGIFMSVQQISPKTIRITLANANAYDVYLVNPAGAPDGSTGQPSFIIGGQLITATSGLAGSVTSTAPSTTGQPTVDVQFPPAVEGGAAGSKRGDRLYQFSANPFIQSIATGTSLAQDIVIDQYLPRPLYTNVDIVADPRLQLADVCMIADGDALGINAPAMIFSSNFSVSKTDWGQALDLRSMTSPGGWILGLAGSSELGTDTYV